ncbi:MAG: SusD/RagB family nutrient-binding outer membrane lipoprotein [Saprospiraceae bacterium]
MKFIKNISLALLLVGLGACSQFEEFNQNPNEPTTVSADVLLPAAIRKSVNTSVDASFLVGNNAAQLTAKTLRLEVDAYNWNAFPTYWEGWYESLTDVVSLENIAVESGNGALEATAITLKSWIFANLTNAYGDIPYNEAIQGATDNFTPAYDDQQAIYMDLLSELERADQLLAAGDGSIDGDILLGGDMDKWRKFANSLRLRLLMYANGQISDAGSQFASIVDKGNILSSNNDNVVLTYTGSFPNEFPLVPLKQGDFDAVAIGKAASDVMESYSDPRLLRFARPNNEDFSNNPTFIGAVNGQGEDCSKDGASRLGVQYYNYPDLTTAASLNLPMAEGVVMTFSEVEFLLAEAAAKGWINDDVETHYRNGIQASMQYHMVDYAAFGYTGGFNEYYSTSGVAYSMVTDIWEQKWFALFFHGLEPYFEVRRWYVESGNSFDGIPFLNATCGNLNSDNLPLRFLYPGEEQSLNASNYSNAIDKLGGSNNQNAQMWLVQ